MTPRPSPLDHDRRRPAGPPRWLFGVTGAAVVAAGVVVALSPMQGAPAATGTPAVDVPAPTAGAAAAPSTTAPSPTTTTAPATTAPAATTAAPPTTAQTAQAAAAVTGGPVLTAMSPSSGPAGTRVTLSGTGLWSPSGTVTVRFGDVATSVDCSSRTRCTATAPPGHHGGAVVPVTFTGAGGTSQAVSFRYS